MDKKGGRGKPIEKRTGKPLERPPFPKGGLPWMDWKGRRD